MASDATSPLVLPASVASARYTAAKVLLDAWHARATEWSRAVRPPSEEEVEELADDMATAARLVRGMIREESRRG